MAAPWQGLPVRLERAPHRGAAIALSNASKRARIRSLGSRSRGSLFIFRSSPAVAPRAPRYRLARDHGLPALRDVHLLVNVLHGDVLLPPFPTRRSSDLGPPACAAPCSCHHEACSARSAWPHPGKACPSV